MTSVLGLDSFNFGRELGDIAFIEVVAFPDSWLEIVELEIDDPTSELGEIRLTGFISLDVSIVVGLTDFPSLIADEKY